MTRTWTQTEVESIARDAIGAYCEALSGDRPDEQAAAVAMINVSEGLDHWEPLVETGRTSTDSPVSGIPRKDAPLITIELCEEDLHEIQVRIGPFRHLERAWNTIYDTLHKVRR